MTAIRKHTGQPNITFYEYFDINAQDLSGEYTGLRRRVLGGCAHVMSEGHVCCKQEEDVMQS